MAGSGTRIQSITGDVTNLGADGLTVRVTGLRDTLRALGEAGAKAQDMSKLMHQMGNTVVAAAIPRAPRGESAALVASIRAGKGKTKAVVRAGGKRVPYAGVVHYGWPAKNIAPNQFLREAIAASRSAVIHQLNTGLAKLLAETDLA